MLNSSSVVTLVAPSTTSDLKGDTTPHGALTIMDKHGEPTGFLNAEEITAFRTALASSLLLARRTSLKTLVIFGRGKQAYWHARLALLLRGHTIKHVHFINRTLSEKTRNLIIKFIGTDGDVKEREGWHNTKFSMLGQNYGEYGRIIKEQLRAADAIICTVPSTSPLFDHAILTATEGRKKGRLCIAIGSYKPDMIELPVELLHQAVKPAHDHRHFHKHAPEGGVVVVDTLTGCLKEAGEITQGKLTPMQLVELGELVMLDGQFASIEEQESEGLDNDLAKLKMENGSVPGSLASVMREDSSGSTISRKSSFSRMSRRSSRSLTKENTRSSSTDSRKGVRKNDAMSKWLSDGNVIYKSVGMGLMDLVVGSDLVSLARKNGIGTTIPKF